MRSFILVLVAVLLVGCTGSTVGTVRDVCSVTNTICQTAGFLCSVIGDSTKAEMKAVSVNRDSLLNVLKVNMEELERSVHGNQR